jgi:tyrosine-protein phosphatase YwqE
MATDAHNTKKRPPLYRAARSRVTELVGERITEALFVDNPKSIVENRGLVYDPDVPELSRNESVSLFSRVKRFLSR